MTCAKQLSVIALLVLLAGAVSVPAQPLPRPEARKQADTPCTLPNVPAERVRAAMDAADALPAPLTADAKIRIGMKISSACPKLAKELLERAFEQAKSVEPGSAYEQAYGSSLDSRVSYAAHGYAMQLDRLSLSARAVMAMLPLDAKTAVKLFREIPIPSAAATRCSDAFIPDVSIYYEALNKVFAVIRPIKPATDADGRASYVMLQDLVRATNSPVQLDPLTTLIEKAPLRDAELSSLVDLLAGALDSFPADERSFYGRQSGEFKGPAQAMDKLVALSRAHDISCLLLLKSYRDYLDRSLQGPRCEDTGQGNIAGVRELFNKRFSEEVGTASTDIPVKIAEPRPQEGQYWSSPKAKQLLLDAQHLNFGDDGHRFSDAEKETLEWKDRVGHLLDHVADWYPQDEHTPADYFHQKCILLLRILLHLKRGPLYDRIVAMRVQTLEESSLLFDNPAEWYYEVFNFLHDSRHDSHLPVPPQVLAAFRNSSSSYLRAVGAIAALAE